jgi:hypothetical protein
VQTVAMLAAVYLMAFDDAPLVTSAQQQLDLYGAADVCAHAFGPFCFRCACVWFHAFAQRLLIPFWLSRTGRGRVSRVLCLVIRNVHTKSFWSTPSPGVTDFKP